MRFKTLVCTLGVLAFSAPSCRRVADTREGRVADSSEVVAKVGDTVITVADVEERINKQTSFTRARYADPTKKRQFVDELVQNEALANEAVRRGYDKDPEVQQAVTQQMVSTLLRKDFDAKLKVEDVPEADIERYYNDHLAAFHQKAAAGVRAIVAKSKAKADHAYAAARGLPKSLDEQQEAFGELVTKYSDAPEPKSLAADLLFFSQDSRVVPKAIIDAAFKLKVAGDVAPPVKVDQGWAVILLTQRQPEISRSLPAVKREIQTRLFRDLRPKALAAFVEDLRKKSRVTINEANLSKVVVEAGSRQPHGLNFPGGLEAPASAPPEMPASQPAGTPPRARTSGTTSTPAHP